MVGSRGISDGIAHRRHKLIAHGHVERGVSRHDTVERAGLMNQAVVVETEEGKLMVGRLRLVPLVSDVSSERHHLEEASAVFPVGTQREGGGRRYAEMAPMDNRHHEARKLKRKFRAELVGVEQGIAPAAPRTRLPFVRAKNLERHFFAATESIALRDAIGNARTHLLIALQRGIHFKTAVEKFVHDGGDIEIERVAVFRGVLRHIVDINLTEHAHSAELFERRVAVAQSERVRLCDG